MQMMCALGRLKVTVGSCCLLSLFLRVFVTVIALFVSATTDGHFKRKTRGANIYHVMRYLSVLLA